MDDVPTHRVKQFQTKLPDYLTTKPELLGKIDDEKAPICDFDSNCCLSLATVVNLAVTNS